MKRTIVVILMIFSLSFLFGFTNKPSFKNVDDFIMLSLDFSSNGEIVQSLDFSVNSERLSQESKSVKELLDFKKALAKQVDALRQEFLVSFALIYMENPVEEFKINKGVLLPPVTYNQENDTIGFKIGFTSAEAWNYYHASSEEDRQEKDKKKNPFLNKIQSKGVFPFSVEIKTFENSNRLVGSRYKEKYINACKGFSFYDLATKNYQPAFIYNYSTFNNRLRSDADLNFTDSAGHLHHVWLVAESSLQNDNTITLFYFKINKGLWLLLAIIIPLIIMTCFIILIKIKEKRKKTQNFGTKA